jgi:hypothetical protein
MLLEDDVSASSRNQGMTVRQPCGENLQNGGVAHLPEI